MAKFTVQEFQEFLRLLREEPELREELKRLIVAEEILRLERALYELARAEKETKEALKVLSDEVRALAEAQRKTEERVDALAEAQRKTEERVDALAEAQRRTEERLEALTARVDALAEAQRKTEEKVKELVEAQRRLEERIEELAEAQIRTERTLQRLIGEVAELKGKDLEREYREKAFAYFSGLIRRAHVLSPDEISELLDKAVEEGLLADREADEIAWADAIVRGKWKGDREEVYLVVEVSWGIGKEDVERAKERAMLLSKLGLKAVPVVAGRAISDEVSSLAQEAGVLEVIDGEVRR